MILIVTPTAGLYGGTERVLELLLMSPEARGGIAVAFLEDGPLVSIAAKNKICHRLIPRKNFSNLLDTALVVRRLREYTREVEASVMLAWTDFAQLYAAPAAWRVCPSLWWQRTNVDRGMVAKLCRWLPSYGVLANSRFTRDQLSKEGFRVADQPLYPPFEAEVFSPQHDRHALREKLGLPQNRRVVGSVGRLQTWKGFDTFVDAIARLRRDHKDLIGLIVGGPHNLEADYEHKLMARIDRLGLADQILMAGAQRNVSEWMAAMDVFVHAADREPFGIVVPEAMALGLPVVASIPGGPAEVIEDGVSGLLVQSKDVTGLSNAIERLITDRKFAASCGRRAQTASQQYASVDFVKRVQHATEISI